MTDEQTIKIWENTKSLIDNKAEIINSFEVINNFINSQKVKIEKLQKTIDLYKKGFMPIVADIKSEAIKEFAEKLKADVRDDTMSYGFRTVCNITLKINNLVEKMTEVGTKC